MEVMEIIMKIRPIEQWIIVSVAVVLGSSVCMKYVEQNTTAFAEQTGSQIAQITDVLKGE